ncbi:hypothetical protein HJC23_013398 [Cyclotella cryptica]|uniref:Autophagy-related protein 16 domain-containing protein n=1 Tax=Cyclotella cryptica TaxID=29204 RepID=A0ABD3PWQ9_9STRA|eukprot:CCRYP_010969-RA/>CCRYP_010969-RA protein AED:0.35 eAED:0.35 QI:0/0/0/1/0/0.33/3/0/571
MEEIYHLIQQRNATETLPFLPIQSTNTYLRYLVDTLHMRCESLERQYLEQQQLVVDQAQLIQQNAASSSNAKPVSSKYENRLHEKIAKLQDKLNNKLQNEVQAAADALETSKELSSLKERCATQDATISAMQMELDRCNEIVKHLSTELEESKSRTRLAENQFDGLKDAIRALQDENEEKTKLNDRLIQDAVAVKEKYMEQFNNMNDSVEKLQKEVNMLRALSQMNKSWFGLPKFPKNPGATKDNADIEEPKSPGRQWGTVGAVLPSQPQFTIHAHKHDASCVRYDGSNRNLVATASSDSTVRVWDTSNGQLQATFSGGGSHPMLGVDISGGIVCGCGADKTCRVWRYDTKRMIHQLAGHSQKITCIRLFPGEKNVFTASADRSMKLWDISRNTYRQVIQTLTFRHSSTANCSDISIETQSVVTGHLDGGTRFWDVRTGDRVLDIPDLHDGGVTSVQWNPQSSHEVLTNGRDSTLKILDARKNAAVCVFHDPGFRTLTNYASSSFSPDSVYVAACSGENGDVFVWNVAKNALEKRLSGHNSGGIGLAWGVGGTNGQQVATIDKSGVLVLWA